MKKTVAFFVSLCMALVLIAVPVYGAEDRPIRVMVDGAELAFDVDPVIENDRTLVPMRLIFEALGAKVDWDEATRTALAVKGDVKISITIDSAELMKNSKAVALDAPARLIGGRTLVPVRAVSEGMGAKVDWNEASRMVQIVTILPTKQPLPADSKNDDYITTPQDKHTLSFGTLSNEDMLRLLDQVPQIRADYELNILPEAVRNEAAYLETTLESSIVAAGEFAEKVWNNLLTDRIIEIQLTSDTEYVYNEYPTAEEVERGFLNLIQTAGLNFEHYYRYDQSAAWRGTTVGYTSSFGSGVLYYKGATKIMLLESFHAMQENDVKFIGIIPGSYYFTAELKEQQNRKLNFCEITKEDHKVIKEIEDRMENFEIAIQEFWETGA